MLLNVLFLIVGLALTVVGAEYFIAGSSYIARKFGIPKLIIGLTIVALGTSAPEFAINLLASIDGHTDLALGNILGSNISNLLLIFGGSALFARKIKISQDSLTQISLTVLVAFATFLLATLTLSGQKSIVSMEGLLLLFIGGFYWLYLYNITKRDKERLAEEELEESKFRKIKSLPLILTITFVSLAGLLFGSRLVTNSAVYIAQVIGLSEFIIAGTIIAFGTSLPELVTGIQAVRQKHYDLLVGNVVGSNVINTLFILGSSALIRPISVGSEAIPYLHVNSIASILLLISFTIYKPREFKRPGAFVFIFLYFAFLIFVLY